MPEMNTIYDDMRKIVGYCKFAIAWSKDPSTRLGHYDRGDSGGLYNNEGQKVARFENGRVLKLDGTLVGQYVEVPYFEMTGTREPLLKDSKIKRLEVNNRVVGWCGGDPGSVLDPLAQQFFSSSQSIAVSPSTPNKAFQTDKVAVSHLWLRGAVMSKLIHLKIEAGICYGMALLASTMWFDLQVTTLGRNADAFVAYVLIVAFGAVMAGYFSKLYVHASPGINGASIVSAPIAIVLSATYLASICYFTPMFLPSVIAGKEPLLDLVVSIIFSPLLFIVMSWPALLIGLIVATCVMRIRGRRLQSCDAL
jgi:hypothetical protein